VVRLGVPICLSKGLFAMHPDFKLTLANKVFYMDSGAFFGSNP
jgi:hypothetical protein